MKKIITLGLSMVVLNLTGCVSYYNHTRVQNNSIREQAIKNNDIETLRYIASGSSPKQALKQKQQAVRIKILESNGEVEGLAFAFDPINVGSYFATFKEAPYSSAAALVADAAIAYGITKLGENLNSGGNNKSRDNITIVANGESTVSISGSNMLSPITTDNRDYKVDNSNYISNPTPAP
jgi:hypothetical protein